MGNTPGSPGLRFDTTPLPNFNVPMVNQNWVDEIVHPVLPQRRRRHPRMVEPVITRVIIRGRPPTTRKHYTPSERQEAVAMVTEQGMTYRQAAVRMGLRCSCASVYRWRRAQLRREHGM